MAGSGSSGTGRGDALTILKIGGSLLTERSAPCRVAEATLRRLARLLARDRPSALVLVHGLGTFGRAVLPLYDGTRIPPTRSHLARRVQAVLRELHDRVVDALDAAGVPIVPLDAQTLFAFDAGRIAMAATDVLHFHLARGGLPVLHGGTFVDSAGGFSIVSSDAMLVELSWRMAAERVIWATDVDGILDRQRRLLPVVHRSNLEAIWRPPGPDADPVGSMDSKVDEALRLADQGVSSFIVNGRHPARVQAALAGETTTGTLVAPPPGRA